MRSRVRWQRVCWVAARGSSASQKTQADFSLVCWQLSRTRSRRPMSNGTSLPAGLSRSSAPLAALSQGWATRCIRPLILVPPSLLHLPTTRVCGDLTCACLRPLVVAMPRYLAARCHSTAPGWQAQHLLISGCRLSCCAVWPCLPGRRGYSATSPKSYATPSHPTSTLRSTGTPCIGQPPATISQNNASSNSPKTCYVHRLCSKEEVMAKIVAILATTHHPFFYRASTAPPESRPDFADEWVRKVEAYRETLTRARPDVLVMVGSDHFHQLFYDNMPQFLIGKAPFYDANYYNEEREFGLPRMLLKGHEEFSAYLLRAGLDAGFDFAFSNELRVDHSITCPIITTRPQADLPIVPIYTNIFAPPLPQPWRFVELGRTLRRLIEAWPSDQRVAVIGTGHLSLELGGPRQFGPHGPDPEFDRKAVEWIATSDLERALAEVTLDSLYLPGNATHGFMDFMLMMGVATGVAGADRKADYADTYDLFHTMEAYFTWYPNGPEGG